MLFTSLQYQIQKYNYRQLFSSCMNQLYLDDQYLTIHFSTGLQISPHPMTDDYARGKNEDDSVTLEWTDRTTTTTGFT